ncbi:hypothetical protein WG66_014899, partial [Moniliophthora roreri]
MRTVARGIFLGSRLTFRIYFFRSPALILPSASLQAQRSGETKPLTGAIDLVKGRDEKGHWCYRSDEFIFEWSQRGGGVAEPLGRDEGLPFGIVHYPCVYVQTVFASIPIPNSIYGESLNLLRRVYTLLLSLAR